MKKFLSAFLLLVLMLTLSLKLKLFFGFAPDFVAALLITFGFIFSFYETAILGAFGLWILNWRPLPGRELLVLAGLMLLAYLGRYFMPFKRFVSLGAITLLGTLLLYAVALPGLFIAEFKWIALDAALATLFAFLILHTFRSLYGEI